MGILMSLHAFDYSTRDPLRPRPFDFSTAFYQALFEYFESIGAYQSIWEELA